MTTVHRLFYPTTKPGEDPRSSRPVVKASPIVESRGVQLDFLQSSRHFTPDELAMLAKWLFALSHETKELAAAGLITEGSGWDVIKGEVVSN